MDAPTKHLLNDAGLFKYHGMFHNGNLNYCANSSYRFIDGKYYNNFKYLNEDFYQNYFSPTKNIIVNKKLAKKSSLLEKIDQLPGIPYMFLHALDDKQVHPSETIHTYDKLVKKGYKNLFAIIVSEGEHRFFCDHDTKENSYKHPVADELVSKIIFFLEGDFSKLSNKITLDNEKFDSGRKLLSTRKVDDMVEAKVKFLKGEKTELKYTNESGTKDYTFEKGIYSFFKTYTEFLKSAFQQRVNVKDLKAALEKYPNLFTNDECTSIKERSFEQIIRNKIFLDSECNRLKDLIKEYRGGDLDGKLVSEIDTLLGQSDEVHEL
jgi:hypothetical protein